MDFLPQQKPEQSRLIPSYLQAEIHCELCAYEYDLAQRVPMMLCTSQHNCCLICVKQIIIRKKQCPFCRKNITVSEIQKNRMLSKILEEVARKRGLPIQINENPEKQFIQQRDSFLVPPSQNLPPDVNALLNEEILADYRALLNQAEPANQSCCQKICKRIEFKQPLYCFAYFLVMFYNFPFFTCELIYSLHPGQYQCYDTDFGAGVSLRSWLYSSALIGLSMYGLQVFVIFWKICLPERKKLPHSITILNILFFILKFLGYNIFGFVVYGSINSDGQADCTGGVLDYMEALFIIQIVIMCALCSLVDRRRR